ncbi:MAG: hypothetical protein AAGI15_11040 [Pseudomonadota bacterium]
MSFAKKIISLSILPAAVLGATSALAQPSTGPEFRGYSKCVDTAQRASRGLTTDRFYLTNTSAEAREYFINGTRWESGDRVKVRINCETSVSGRKLISYNIDQGQYRNTRGSVTVEVAER